MCAPSVLFVTVNRCNCCVIYYHSNMYSAVYMYTWLEQINNRSELVQVGLYNVDRISYGTSPFQLFFFFLKKKTELHNSFNLESAFNIYG